MVLNIFLIIVIAFLTSAIMNWICFLLDNRFKIAALCSVLGFLTIFVISRFDNSYNIAWWSAALGLIFTGAASRNSEKEDKRKKWLGQAFYLIAAVVSYVIFYGQFTS